MDYSTIYISSDISIEVQSILHVFQVNKKLLVTS